MRRATVALALLVLGGCDTTSRNPPIHLNPNMDDQPKYKAQSASPFFYNGSTMQPPVAGTVARGAVLDDEVTTGYDVWGNYLEAPPMEVTDALLARGKQRYGIYCAPCHAASGNGDGMLTQRAKIRTADLLGKKVRAMPTGRLFDIITNGAGLMPSYAYPIEPVDRWKIAAWVQQLQKGASP